MKFFKCFVDILGFCLAKMPHWLFMCCVSMLAWIMSKIDRRRHRDARANLDLVYGEDMDNAQKEAIIKRCYKNFAFVLLESIRVPFIPMEEHSARFDFVDEKYILESLARDGSAVLVSAHFGYWEAMASVLPPRYHWCNMASLGRLTAFKAINEMIIARRELQHVKFIDKKGAFKHLLKLYSGKNALAGILIDQNMSESEGIWVEFFGKKVTHTTIASVLSRRFGVGVVVVMIGISEDYRRFEVRFYEPIYCEKSEDSVDDIFRATQAQARTIETAIAHKPQDWFWFHRRFKSAYGEIYN